MGGTFILFRSALIGYRVIPEQELIVVFFHAGISGFSTGGVLTGGPTEWSLSPQEGWLCDLGFDLDLSDPPGVQINDDLQEGGVIAVGLITGG